MLVDAFDVTACCLGFIIITVASLVIELKHVIAFLMQDLFGVSMIVPLLPKLINNLGASRALAGLIGEYTVLGSISLVPRPSMEGRGKEGLVYTACACAVIIQILNNLITYRYFVVYLPFDLNS